MARPTLRGHRKFKRLMRILNLPEPYVLGLLQMIWDAAYESGDDVLGDSLDVESVAGWPGERGVLTQALLDAGGEQAGFIEPVNGRPGAYQVHDLWQHAPRYVQKRAEREAERRAAGLTISEIRRAAGSIGGKHTASKRASLATPLPATEQQIDSKVVANLSTPAPAPAPAPLGKKESSSPNDNGVSEARPRDVEEVRSEVERLGYQVDPDAFWNFYESKGWKVGKNPIVKWRSCLVTWQKRNGSSQPGKSPAQAGLFEGKYPRKEYPQYEK